MWTPKTPKRRSSTAGLEGPPGWRDMVGWGVMVRLLKISALEPEQKVKVGKMTSYFCLTEVLFFFWILGSIFSFLGVATCWGWWKTPLSMNVRFTYAWSFFIFAGCQADVYPFCSHNHVRFTNHPCHISYVPFGQAFLPPQRASLKNVICTPENSHDWPENIMFQYRKYIFKGWIFHCHVDFRGCRKGNSTPRNASIWIGASWYLCSADIQAGAVCCPVPPTTKGD